MTIDRCDPQDIHTEPNPNDLFPPSTCFENQGCSSQLRLIAQAAAQSQQRAKGPPFRTTLTTVHERSETTHNQLAVELLSIKSRDFRHGLGKSLCAMAMVFPRRSAISRRRGRRLDDEDQGLGRPRASRRHLLCLGMLFVLLPGPAFAATAILSLRSRDEVCGSDGRPGRDAAVSQRLWHCVKGRWWTVVAHVRGFVLLGDQGV